LGQGHTNSPAPIEGWFREIQIDGDMTLNGLNDCIQHLLGWDNIHCYIFTVHEKHYAYLCEEDDFTVEDVFENHCSTKIPLYLWLRLRGGIAGGYLVTRDKMTYETTMSPATMSRKRTPH
jgi:hypothetical protein